MIEAEHDWDYVDPYYARRTDDRIGRHRLLLRPQSGGRVQKSASPGEWRVYKGNVQERRLYATRALAAQAVWKASRAITLNDVNRELERVWETQPAPEFFWYGEDE